MPITRISVDNPVFATMMMVALMVLGLFSYNRLGVDQFPDVDFPVVVVSTSYPGASPETVETDITRPVEDAINTIAGIKTLTSRSYEGQSVVIAEFDLKTSSVQALQDVREKVSAIRATFRDEVKDPQITRFNPDDQPILSIAVTSDLRPLRDLTTLTDQVVLKRLQNVRGVGRATIAGGVKRQILVRLKPEKLEALTIGVDEVIETLAGENQDVPAGTVTGGGSERVVQVEGRVRDPLDLMDLIVARRGGSPVRLGQVAEVIDGQEEQDTAALLNGSPALAVDVVKVQGANTVEVARGLQEAIRDLRTSGALPPDVSLAVVRDSSRGITNSLSNVQETLVEGGILTVMIVMVFLGSWRSTVITALTLPVAVLGTFGVLAALGFTLNIMTLMALSLAIGILIDDAIVVRENIMRHLHRGQGHRQAALDGTAEIGLAVLATTLTIVAVFLPVAFMGGIIGRFFLQFGITVSAAVLISLFVSFTLDPMLSSVWYDPAAHGRHGRSVFGRFAAAFERGFEALARGYGRLLRWGLRRRWLVILAALAIFVGSFFLVPRIGVEFVPAADLGEQIVEVETPVGSSLAYTTAKVRQVEAAIREFPEIAYTYATVNTGVSVGHNRGSLYLRYTPIDQRRRSPNDLAPLLRQRLSAIPGATVGIAIPGVGGVQKQIQVSVQGRDIATLDRISQQVGAAMRGIPGFVDIDSTLKAAKPTLAVRLERDLASDLGIGTAKVADSLRPLFAGDTVSSWKAPDGESYDVLVRLPEIDREHRADLDRIYLSGGPNGGPNGGMEAGGTPRMIPLSQVARVETTLGASQINRRDLQREVNVQANVQGRAAGDAGRDLQAALAKIDLPPGYRIVFGGSTKDIAETSGYAAQALALAVILIYLILASQFGSFLQPLAIMASLPLSLVGVFLGLLVAGSTLNIFSAIGFIMLMGLVTKNAILLVDFANQARKRGVALHDALVEAGIIRLRPIVMTTAAMIFGMLPLALGIGEGAQQRAPMAHAVIGGLLSSTVLTLLVVPVALTYLDGLSRRTKRWFAHPDPHRPDPHRPDPHRPDPGSQPAGSD
ncbi:efflux RND transporter permease subunit [Azospirillum picis]|uniref:HAE1 family hydrophobic/amphiphilic exporter-1 n=1 Tax=Azospirillum picis TaxID=488438 RepID=A0ABU0MUJ5_9PROT|nr:efflux RND transporter permease subunit [Azospirillum picis]MBP2302994.1 HAE1 family hydrophobic/amphiphilic exporter-1 [Azospirillum picis]MDQ0536746.1 HAE1 family hydrophobic/amphiphilic exporter-1 [Azospirillum picis]